MKKYYQYLFLLFSITSFAQPTIDWKKTYGGSNYDFGRNILQTTDGGYITVIYSFSNDFDISGNHGGSDIVVVKFSVLGDIEWQHSYGGSNSETASSIQKTTDGGYIIVGTTSSNNGDVSGNHGFDDVWVIKIANTGTLEWQKCLGGSNGESGQAIEQTLDGGYIVGGTTASNNGNVSGNHYLTGSSGSNDYWVVKLTNSGSFVWQKCLGSYSSDYLYSIKQTIDGGYIVNGNIQANDGDVTGHHGDFDYWVVKLNTSGVIEWQKALGGTNWDTGLKIIQNSDGDYIAVGFSSSNNGDVSGSHGGGDGWVVKLGATGTILWQKALGGSGADFIHSVYQTNEGGYILSGDSTSSDGQAPNNHGGIGEVDCWIIKINALGDFEWGKLLGGTGEDTAVSVIQTSDGNYIMSGYTNSSDGDLTTNYGFRDAWIVKLTNVLAISENEFEKSISIYPNPTKEFININLGEYFTNDLSYYIYNQQSEIVLKGKLNSFSSKISIEGISNGIYFLKIGNNKTGIKFIKN
jgi:hypothetical protein